MLQETQGTAETGQTTNPTGSNPTQSNQSSSGKSVWADETVRNTAGGPTEVKPVPVIKPTIPNGTPNNQPPVGATPAGQGTPPANPGSPTGGQPATPTTNQPVAPVQTGQSLDPKVLAREFANELRQQHAEQKERSQAEAPLTDQQFNEQFAVVSVTPEDYTSIIGFAPERPEQVVALNGVLQKLNKQSVRMANYMADAKIAELRNEFTSRFSPVLEQTKAQVEERVQNAFFGAYPGFKDYVPLLQEIKEGIVAKGLKFNSAPELIDFVAQKAATLVGKPVDFFKGLSGNNSNQQTTQEQQTAGGSRQMTTTSVGGRVGGAGSATRERKTTAASLFQE